jgi:hypothetical protein
MKTPGGPFLKKGLGKLFGEVRDKKFRGSIPSS